MLDHRIMVFFDRISAVEYLFAGKTWLPMALTPITPEQWYTSRNPAAMLALVPNADERLFRLFACACCRRMWSSLASPESREAVRVGESLADGLAGEEDRRVAERAAQLAKALRNHDATADAAEAAAAVLRGKVTYSANKCSTCVSRGQAILAWGEPLLAVDSMWEENDPHIAAEIAIHADIVRDIFGDPFAPLPVVDRRWLSWNEGAIPRLCAEIYEARNFDRMQTLAAHLRAAGCGDRRIVEHCGLTEHYRGCWLIDVLLGRR